MKTTLFLLLFTSSSFALSLDCSTFKGYRIGAPDSFSLKIIRGEDRGKIEGMTILDGSRLRETPIYGEMKIFDYDDFGGYQAVLFDSDSSSGNGWDFANDYSIEVINEGDNFGKDKNFFSGTLSIQGEKTSIRCRVES